MIKFFIVLAFVMSSFSFAGTKHVIQKVENLQTGEIFYFAELSWKGNDFQEKDCSYDNSRVKQYSLSLTDELNKVCAQGGECEIKWSGHAENCYDGDKTEKKSEKSDKERFACNCRIEFRARGN